ncbi:MAG TPA: hypothetical protein VJ719_09700 [Chthoniobacterales bacterium]|nr:hypothetical protein [Chthoniobacterales bacterium]
MDTALKWSRPVGGAILAFTCVVAPVTAQATDEKSIKKFTEAIIKMEPGVVDPVEAETVSIVSHRTARQLKKDYRAVGPAIFQNFLVNVGARQRGYCAHYARDIGTKLKQLRLKTLDLHWGAADAGTHLEHNVIIVTAPNMDYRTGYIIDGWRNAGRLCWWPVLKDSAYEWKEDLQETAWLNDYKLVRQQPARGAKEQPPKKAAAQAPPKSKPVPKTAEPPAEGPKTANASLEIKG